MYYGLTAILRKELISYFATPVAYVFIAIFLLTSGAFTFYLSDFYGRGIADLKPFFAWHPWLYLFLIPAISMRLWAEERKSGTLEILITSPIPLWQMVAGKFLAAWVFTCVALLCTIPIWLTVSYLGNPDHGVIFASYIGSALMAGGYLAIGSCISALTSSQVVAFIISVVVCFAFTVSGFPMVLGFFQGWLPQIFLDVISSFSFLSNFDEITRGILELRSIGFFLTFIVLMLYLNAYALSKNKET
jgi:ABC-2 type transport system permease protein